MAQGSAGPPAHPTAGRSPSETTVPPPPVDADPVARAAMDAAMMAVKADDARREAGGRKAVGVGVGLRLRLGQGQEEGL